VLCICDAEAMLRGYDTKGEPTKASFRRCNKCFIHFYVARMLTVPFKN